MSYANVKFDTYAGYGDRLITPLPDQELAGFGYYRDRHARQVLDDLKVRALSLRQGKTRLLLICCDLLGLTIDFTDPIRVSLAESHDLPSANILIACTHTHSGPGSQPLEGLGRIAPGYLQRVGIAIREAAAEAVADERPGTVGHHVDEIEPIGYNRRSNTFEPIDPVLTTAIFTREDRKLYIVNYACHPVTLGWTNDVSADWPGATVRDLEADGSRAIVFQGFCGDINPAILRAREGFGTIEDVAQAGSHLAARARLGASRAVSVGIPALSAVETRIDLPLAVPSPAEIAAAAERLRKTPAFPSSTRFYQWWEGEALARQAEFAAKPYLNVPVQAMAIGNLRLVALPGEAFCEYGRRLRERTPNLLTVGFANGNVGYFPTTQAYSDLDDYACYQAPLFYAVYPFKSDVENIVMDACSAALAAL